jgi:uncharacterized protein YndB with AHSA1/START domain
MKNTGNLKVTTPTDTEIVMTRVFNAPRHLVYEAMMKPELIKRWLGPRHLQLIVCEVDARVGGRYRYVQRLEDGKEMGWGGVFKEIQPPERCVFVESFDDYPGESLVTTILTEVDGKTTLTMTMKFASKEVRDMVAATGMEHGVAESYDRLEEVLAAM